MIKGLYEKYTVNSILKFEWLNVFHLRSETGKTVSSQSSNQHRPRGPSQCNQEGGKKIRENKRKEIKDVQITKEGLKPFISITQLCL